MQPIGDRITSFRRGLIGPVTSKLSADTFGTVVWDSSGSVFRMFFGQQGGADGNQNNIMQMVSANGRTWTDRAVSLVPLAAAWDQTWLRVPYVWYESGEARPWRMIYAGITSGGNSQIGLATNTDARMANGDPFERKDTAGNALSTPVLSQGGVGQWDNGKSLDHGVVLKVGSTYYLYYDTIDSGSRSTGIATSSDLVTWTKDANNPIFVGSITPTDKDTSSPTGDEDGDKGRFCPDVVRWDTDNGETRYVMYMVHYSGTNDDDRFEVYSSPAPTFYESERTYEGVMFGPCTVGNGELMAGLEIQGSDTPRCVLDGAERNVRTQRPDACGDWLWCFISIHDTAGAWNQEMLYHHMELSDATLSDVWFDTPLYDPAFVVAPTTQANLKGLWIPGTTGDLLDWSGNGNHMPQGGVSLDATDGLQYIGWAYSGTRFDAAGLSSLNAIGGDFTIEMIVRFPSGANALTAGQTNGILYYGDGTNHKLYYLLTCPSADPLQIKPRILATTDGDALDEDHTITIAYDTDYHLSCCRSATGHVYWALDGVHLRDDGASTGTIVDVSALTPYLALGLTTGGTTQGAMNIKAMRITDNCKWTTSNFTPPALSEFAPAYPAVGTVYSPVYTYAKAGKGRFTGIATTPDVTEVNFFGRDALDADDSSVDIGDYSAYPAAVPVGQYHQWAAQLVPTATQTPEVTFMIPMAWPLDDFPRTRMSMGVGL